MKKKLILLIMCVSISAACAPMDSSPAPVRTLIPTPQAQRSAQAPLVYLAVTRDGQEIRFTRILLEANEYVAYHTQGVPGGIPLASGVEVSFDYISQVDISVPSSDWDEPPPTQGAPKPLVNPAGEVALPDFISERGHWRVEVTLTDGSRISSDLGFKAHHKIHLTGESDYGFLDIPLADFQTIVVQRADDPEPVPAQPPEGERIYVETRGGDLVLISRPALFISCMYDVYCCRGEEARALPLEGLDIPFDEIHSAVFSEQAVSLDLRDGSAVSSRLRASPDCPGIGWRLRGKAALGDFELPLALIYKITR